MKKKLGAFNLLWICLTSMIGSGWLFGSLYSAHYAGPAAIIAWPIAGFLLLLLALSYAEVATMFQQASCLACMPLYTHGRLTSITLSGLAWLSLATIPVIETQGLVQYASNYIPNIMYQHGVYYSCTPLGYLLALILLMSFGIINYFGLTLFARLNDGFTIWKLIIPITTIIVLFTASYHAGNFTAYGGFMPYGWQGVMKAMSSGGVLFSLLGFRQVVIMMSEVENPGKYVPIVLIASLIITSLIYTALQWVFIGSLRPEDLVHGWANLSFVGDAGPFAALAALAGMIWLSLLLYSDAFISPFSTALVYTTTASRMLASMGTMQDVPPITAALNQYQTPWISLIINFVIGAFMFLLLHNWQAMASFLVAVMMISYAVGPICLVSLRHQLPAHARPFRLPCGHLIAFIGFYVCTAGAYWAGFNSMIKIVMLAIPGLALLIFYRYLKNKPLAELDVVNAIWLLTYISGLSIFSYFGNYGGIHLLPDYWDLVYLLGFSFVIFMLAIMCRKSETYTQLQYQTMMGI